MTRYPTYRWALVCLYLFSSVSAQMVINTLGILLPAISESLALKPSEQGLLGSAPFWSTIVLAIPIGWAGSRLSPKWLTAITLVGCSMCLFLQSWAPVFAALLLGRLLFGIFTIAQQPARAILTRQWFPLREVVLVNGLSNVFFGLVVGGGLALSPVILILLGDDWRGTMRIFGFYYVALTVLWLIFGRDRVTEEFSSGESQPLLPLLRTALNHRDLWLCGGGFAGATMAFSAFVAFYPTLMLQEYDVSLRVSGLALALDVVLGGIGGLAIGYYAATWRKEGQFLQALGIIMVVSFLGMILSGSVVMIYTMAIINGVAWTFFPILITVPFNLRGIQPRQLAVAFSFTMMLISTGQALGPLFIGFLEEATGDLKLAMFIASFSPLSLVIAGTTLSFGRQPATAPAAGD
jgi:ACS family glucarate transporter-like MFS transporter